MKNYSGYETYRPTRVPFAELVAPLDYVSEALVAAFGAVVDFVGRIIRRCFDEFVIARTAAELSRLDDHILRDIGIHRSDIYRVARGVVEDPNAGFRVAGGDRG